MARGGGNKKRYQYCTDSSRNIVNFGVLQGHSRRSLIDLARKDNVIPSNFFQYIYHVGCAISLHSIINSGLTPGGLKFEQETDSILLACWSYGQKSQRSLHDRFGSTAPCIINTCTKHGRNIRTRQLGGHQSCCEEGLKFYQTRSNAIILQETLVACCIPKVVRMETGEVLYEKSINVTSASTKDLLETRLEKRIGLLLNDDTEKLFNNPEVSNRTNQFQTQVMIERSNPLLEPSERGNPLLEPTQGSRPVEEKRPVLRRSKNVLLMKKLLDMIERCNPLLKQTRGSDRVKFQCGRRNNSWSNGATHCKPWRIKSWANNAERGERWLPHSRVTTFRCEACWEFTRSRIDSENWEPPRWTRSSTRSTTKQSLQAVHQSRWFRTWTT